MRTMIKRTAAAFTIATLIATTTPAGAGPVPTNLAGIASTPQQTSHVTQVRWRGYGYGGVAAGVAAGIITGAIIAGAANSYYYGPGPYYYDYGPYGPYYGPNYYYGPGPGYYGPPGYYAPRYRYYRDAPLYAPPPGAYIAPY